MDIEAADPLRTLHRGRAETLKLYWAFVVALVDYATLQVLLFARQVSVWMDIAQNEVVDWIYDPKLTYGTVVPWAIFVSS